MKPSVWRIWAGRILSEWKKINKEFKPPPGTSRLAVFVDYVVCVFRYHVSYSEYFVQYKFYDLKRSGREQYITRAQAHRLAMRLNAKTKETFWFKDKFLKKYADFVNRDWLYLKEASLEQFKQFTDVHRRFIAKPVTGSLGLGIKIISADDPSDVAFLYEDLKTKDYLVEELVTACSEIAGFNPDSLNTVRVVTFLDGNNVRLVGSFFRMGLKGKNIDNAHAGGIFAKVDVNTGILVTEGVNTDGQNFIFHPTSHKQIIGFQIPMWNEIVNTVRLAANANQEAKIVGWDVAIKSDYSIVIIEGNHMPDFDTMQSPARKGVRKELMEIVNGS